MVLDKKIGRDFKNNLLRNTAMILIIALSMALIVSLCSSADNITYTINKEWVQCRVEDGCFETYTPLTNRNLKDLAEINVQIEKMFYTDISSGGSSILRVFASRRNIDLPYAEDGHLPNEDNEVFLEKLYASGHDISVGDKIYIGETEFTVCGIGCFPDYSYVKQNTSDVAANAEFGIAAVNNNSFVKLSRNNKTIYNYAYILGDGCTVRDLKTKLMHLKFDAGAIKDTYLRGAASAASNAQNELTQATDGLKSGAAALADGISRLKKAFAGSEYAQSVGGLYDGAQQMYIGIDKFQNEVEKYLDENSDTEIVNISSFQETQYNIRIKDAVDDSQISKQAALVIGVFLLILLVYMLAVFASGTIEAERSVIGTLYAIGYSRREILSHYVKTPVLIAFCGAMLGAAGGFLLNDTISSSYTSMYSFPNIIHRYSLYLVVYAVGMPITLAYIMNILVLRKKLNHTPLAMMHSSHIYNGGFKVNLSGMSFAAKYKIRQFFREMRGNLTLFAGIIVSLMIIMFSVACYGSISDYINGIADDVHYNFMYILRNPVTDLPKNSVVGYARGFYVDFPMTGEEMEVSLLGIDRDNPFFDFAPQLADESDKIYMSSSARIKFGYHTGDKIVFRDNSEDKFYAFEIADEVTFGNGLYFFMNINAMRKAFGQPYFDKEDLKKGERIPKSENYYYNTVFSNKKLEFKHNMMLSEISKADMQRGASKFMTLMWDMILMMIAVSVIIFTAVMYLLMKLQIDRSAYSISLLKALGYKENAVNAFYLDGSLFITIAAAVFGIPLSRFVVGKAYPFCVSNVNAGFAVKVSALQYGIIIVIIAAAYCMTRTMLVRYLKKIDLTAILKNRE